MRIMTLLIAAAAIASALPCAAQLPSAEGHASYARTTQSHQNAWGAGGNVELTWGGKQAPAQLGTALGLDYQKEENGGSKQTNASLDVTLQPGGGSLFTPYAGGSVSENWMSGPGSPSGAQLGLQYIIGAQLKLGPGSPLALTAEVRPGYVRTQEHSVTARLGVTVQL